MHPYTYSISLRVRHPNIDLNYLGSLLKLEPNRVWVAGGRRRTPKDTPLKGINKESYWCARLPKDPEKSETCPLEDKLNEWTAKLSAYRAEIAKLLSEGGRIEYFIWIYCDNNLGFELNHTSIRGRAKRSS